MNALVEPKYAWRMPDYLARRREEVGLLKEAWTGWWFEFWYWGKPGHCQKVIDLLTTVEEKILIEGDFVGAMQDLENYIEKASWATPGVLMYLVRRVVRDLSSDKLQKFIPDSQGE